VAADVLERPLTDRETDQFNKYLELLTKWQRIHRLVGSVEPDWVVRNLFVDSLMFLKVLPAAVREIADLGTGAGFPGVPMKIVKPELRLTLVEAKSRRTSFLSSLVRDLQLDRVKIINERAEALVDRPELRFDAVVLRCAGSLHEILPIAAKLVVPGGSVIASGPPSPANRSAYEWVDVSFGSATRRFAVVRV